MKKEDYLKLIEEDLEEHMDEELYKLAPAVTYLSNNVFDFTTYDTDVSALFVQKAVEVCEAVTMKTNSEYIEKCHENYLWYLLMANMPFFEQRLEWGASVRGAWWDYKLTWRLQYFNLGRGQAMTACKPRGQEDWCEFMAAVSMFWHKHYPGGFSTTDVLSR